MQEVAVAVLILPNGSIVLQRRDNAPTSPHLLSCFGGRMEPGENHAKAVKRELREETSLKNLRLIHVVSIDTSSIKSPPKTTRKIHVYKAFIKNADFNVYEGAGAEVYTPRQLVARTDLSPSTRRWVTYFVEHKLLGFG